MKTPYLRNLINQSPFRLGYIPLTVLLTCFALSPAAQAVNPPPDGGYLGGNTAEGTEALNSVILLPGRGGEVGALRNTAIGYQTLFSDITGSDNTATGYQALKNNTASRNTANGYQALFSNGGGTDNTAVGYQAAFKNTGFVELFLFGRHNTAIGSQALYTNQQGSDNTAVGYKALFNHLGGGGGIGFSGTNTAVGASALENNTTGSNNVALGAAAGQLQTTGSNNVYIGVSDVQGVAGENNACYIASIFGQTSATGIPVLINGYNKLGTATSSKRFKEDVKPMSTVSEALFALKPVTFHYKREIDPNGTPQFGLVAEEVEKVNPNLVARDRDGKPYTVRYDAVNAMLLNEFLKEHRKVQELRSVVAKQEAIAAHQQKHIEALTAGLQKVSAQVEMSKAAPRVVDSH